MIGQSLKPINDRTLSAPGEKIYVGVFKWSQLGDLPQKQQNSRSLPNLSPTNLLQTTWTGSVVMLIRFRNDVV